MSYLVSRIPHRVSNISTRKSDSGFGMTAIIGTDTDLKPDTRNLPSLPRHSTLVTLSNHDTCFTAGGCHVPSPAGRIDGGVSLGQYKRITR
jgi:hypothetical protein